MYCLTSPSLFSSLLRKFGHHTAVLLIFVSSLYIVLPVPVTANSTARHSKSCKMAGLPSAHTALHLTDGPSQLADTKSGQEPAGAVPGLLGPQEREPGYRKIGFGQCGVVFQKTWANHVVKIARRGYDDSLWVDFTAHYRVLKALELSCPGQKMECRVPELYSYVPRSNQGWWSANIHLFPDDKEHPSFSLPAMALISEHIPPLPETFRDRLIHEYCPADLQATARSNPLNHDCLARVYLGKRREPGRPLAPNFTLRNFNLHLDQMLHLGLNLISLARDMGEALAFIHWAARIDGYDIEFVLGSNRQRLNGDDRPVLGGIEDVSELAPHTDIDSIVRTRLFAPDIRLWVLGFNLCTFQWKDLSQGQEQYGISESQWTDAIVGQLETAFFLNDPYYPLPPTRDNETPEEQDIWSTFARTYLEVAAHILEHEEELLRGLPRRFIAAVIARARGAGERPKD